ncbi:LPXTG cell wall anchor domain-containing protein [Streptomyces sp. OF3]|uniref:LPXTG cell wall anchor domain-containing protein n=1 Tax=Streptomyces alkaliterrae TaxID=2213162 RepID=A0A7W3WIA2_9ACTN|nr:LAETG motif-containing sortase-dependent surface protein [Streptomyces alkaliterrae]MBB1252871.1 LPXTG cell wall anchor domain-containing protein [Streptomyces alkaliterrae]
MRIRRAVAAAAATAVIAPAALLAAPAAYADEQPTTAPTAESTDAPGEDDEAGDPDPVPAPTESAPEGEEPKPTPTESEDEDEEPKPTPTEDEDEKPKPTPTEDEDEDEDEEEGPDDGLADCEDIDEDEALIDTDVRGLPSKIVAGSGWKNFTYRVTNNSKQSMKNVAAFADAFAVDKKEYEEIDPVLTHQWFDPNKNAWSTINDELGYFGTTTELKPGEYAEAQMRVKVDAKAPASLGVVMTFGIHVVGDGNCQMSDFNYYEFDILAAGAKPGKIDDAKGEKKPGKKPAPQGGLEKLPVTGKLADTGSDSKLPMFALAGATAVALGAGAMFVVRRRKGSDDSTTAAA